MPHEALYVCEYCDHDQNCHPAAEMNTWHVEGKDAEELICDSCLGDKTEDEVAAGRPARFSPESALEIENAELRKQLQSAFDLIQEYQSMYQHPDNVDPEIAEIEAALTSEKGD